MIQSMLILREPRLHSSESSSRLLWELGKVLSNFTEFFPAQYCCCGCALRRSSPLTRRNPHHHLNSQAGASKGFRLARTVVPKLGNLCCSICLYFNTNFLIWGPNASPEARKLGSPWADFRDLRYQYFLLESKRMVLHPPLHGLIHVPRRLGEGVG